MESKQVEINGASSSSTSSSCGPLYELADLMAQLPIKRGLSEFYNGKSRTFACLSNVASVEDLAKKETRTKCSKSYAHKFGAKAVIIKRSPRSSSSFSFAASKHKKMLNLLSQSKHNLLDYSRCHHFNG